MSETPQIRKLESACLQQSISNQPSADTIQAVRELYRDDLDAMAQALLQMRGFNGRRHAELAAKDDEIDRLRLVIEHVRDLIDEATE